MEKFANFFCDQDSFQLHDASLNTTIPHLSECFQLLFLSTFPTVFLFLFSPVVFYTLKKSVNLSIRTCSPNTFRIILSILLAFNMLILVFYGLYKLFANGEERESLAFFLSICVQFFGFCFATILMIGLGNRGIIASGVLFNFWLLLVLFNLPEVILRINFWRFSDERHHVFRLVICLTNFSFFLIGFILSLFSDRTMYAIRDKSMCPEERCSFFNKITFNWFNRLAFIGYKRPLEVTDLWKLNSKDFSENLVPEFNKNWLAALETYQEKKTRFESLQPPKKITTKDLPSLLYALFKTFRMTLIGALLLKLFFDVLLFTSPQILSLLISFVEDKRSPLWIGIVLSLLMFFIAVLQSFILQYYFHSMFTFGMNLRSVLTSSVYLKAMSLSNEARKKRTLGEIVNLMAVDIQRFQDVSAVLMLFWSSPFQMTLAIFFLWRLLGVSVIGGLIFLFSTVPLNSYLSLKMRKCQVEQMKHKDERIKLMSEILNGMKVLKLYAWEDSIENVVTKIRLKELRILRKIAFYNSAVTLTWACAPFLVAVITFGIYVNTDPEKNLLTPQVTFVGLSLFNLLRFPLATFAMIFSQAVQCAVSNSRLKSFLSDDEMLPFVLQREKSEDAIIIRDGSFAWNNDESNGLTLKDINLSVKKGELIAIVGKVGCGKSSLFSALLGELPKKSGDVKVFGSVAYVPQQPWVLNMTFKENILFGKIFSPNFYQSILEASSLLPDLEALPNGDSTEIGEKGINLSGGQKQRVSLARAVYAESDIILLDDPLSSVDAHVGKHIFENVISNKSGILAGKTRILITHNLHYLKYCDRVLVLSDGKILEGGTYEDLLNSGGILADLIEEYANEETNQKSVDPQENVERENSARSSVTGDDIDKAGDDNDLAINYENQKFIDLVDNDKKHLRGRGTLARPGSNDIEKAPLLKDQKILETLPGDKSKLIEKETVEVGKVKWSVYLSYIRALGCLITLTFISVYIFSSVLGVLSNLWLADWSDRAKERNISGVDESDTNLRLSIYASLGLGQALFVCVASLTMAFGMVRASQTLHEGILRNILHSPMTFFDVTPIGRILNRFGKDVDMMDTRLPSSLMTTIGYIIQGFYIVMIPIIVTPYIVIPLFIIFIIYIYMMRFYVSVSRQLKRLESATRSPIYSHFQESIQGTISIRAYRCIDRFIQESQKKVDDNLVIYYHSIVANRWLAIRLELIGNLIVFFSAFFTVLSRDFGSVTAGLAGLSIAYALNITQTLNWAVRMTSELESNIVAVERIKEYSETETEEKPDDKLRIPPPGWPSKGEINFENFFVRYRKNLDYVLKGISFHVMPAEKVGIVGRTGAGKSSLTLSLFRIIEADSGRILIDGEDISQISLKALRSKITIVPQDPFVFSGSLRMNLDPFERFDDATIWRALKLSHLEPFVLTFEKGLDHMLSEGGENFSVGQRQLLCLARALLRESKILVLDEAAASVDVETDSLIQRTIREQFANCTVLTIAHRLNTVIDSDRVLVMDDGKVKEFDTPSRLLENEYSLFYALAKQAGLV